MEIVDNSRGEEKAMSGINGFNWSDRKFLSKMNECIKHRGSDGEGVFINDNISIGHLRIKELDTDKGKQPIANKDESIWIAYDGIIYNSQFLKKNFEDKDISLGFKTDSELILNAYEKNGPEVFEYLNGEFAFSLYDSRKKCICLVRDRLGIKPLYYYFNGDKFIFSSEIKTFQHVINQSFSLNENSVLEYFLTRNISSESFFKDVKTVEKGCYLKFDLINKTISEHSYFDIFKIVTKDRLSINYDKTEKELIDELDALLNNVVKDQYVSDMSIGTICSGGVDSSLLTAIAKKYNKDLKIFNVKVDDVYLDESKYAKKVAEYLGLCLIEEELNQKKFNELYQHCIYLADLPLIHPGSVGIYLINKRAKKEGINTILAGEGADELFGGYMHYKYFYRRLFLTKTPLLNFLNNKIRGFFYFKDFTSYMLEDGNYLFGHYKDLPFNTTRRDTHKTFYEALEFLEDNFEREMTAYILKDMKYYLPPTLREAERMAMGAGVDIRMLFLDNRIVDFASNLPLKFKVGFFKTKYLLKKVAERYLPKDIIYRKKMGFGIPTEKWLGDECLDFKKVMYTDWEKMYFCR